MDQIRPDARAVSSVEEPKRLFPPPPPGLPAFRPMRPPTASPSTTSPFIAQKVLQFEPSRAEQFNPAQRNEQVKRFQSMRTLNTASLTSLAGKNNSSCYSDMDQSIGDSDKLDKSEFSADQIQTFNCMFRAANLNNLGVLSFLEFRSLLVEFGLGHLTNVMIKEILDGVDSDGSKMVNFGEFIRMWDRAANRDLGLPFGDDLYEALKRAEMLPMKVAPVPFSKAKTFFETKTNQMALESLLERQQLLMRKNRPDIGSRRQNCSQLGGSLSSPASFCSVPQMSVSTVRPPPFF